MSQSGVLRGPTGGGGGGGVVNSLTPDVGAAISSANINVLGYPYGPSATPTVTTHNNGGNFEIEPRAYSTPYVVDPSTTPGTQGSYATIQDAMDAAVVDGASTLSLKEIFIRPSATAYVEDLAIPAGIFLNGQTLYNETLGSMVAIQGNHTIANNSLFKATGITFNGASVTANLFTLSGSTIFDLYNCKLNNVSSSGLIVALTTSGSYFRNCLFLSDPGVSMASCAATFEYCDMFSSNFSLTGNSAPTFLTCNQVGQVTCADASGVIAFNTNFTDASFCIGGTSTSNTQLFNCTFSCADAAIQLVNTAGSSVFMQGCSCTVNAGDGLYLPTTVISVNAESAGSVYKRVTYGGGSGTGIGLNDYYLGVTDTSVPVTITLPSVPIKDRAYIVKDESFAAATNNITVSVSGGGNIDGQSTYLINGNGGSAKFISDGIGNYYVMYTAKMGTEAPRATGLALVSTTLAAVTGDSTAYTILYDNVVGDTNSVYNPASGQVTADRSGWWKFNCTICLSGLTAAQIVYLTLSNDGVFALIRRAGDLFLNVPGDGQVSFDAELMLPMNLNETFTTILTVSGSGTPNITIEGNNQATWFNWEFVRPL